MVVSWNYLHDQRKSTYPKVVSAVDIPLDIVAIPLRKEGLETMGGADACSLFVAGYFVFLVMAMLGVDQVLELSDFVLLVDQMFV